MKGLLFFTSLSSVSNTNQPNTNRIKKTNAALAVTAFFQLDHFI